MKKIVVIVVFLIPILGIAQGNFNSSSKYVNLTSTKQIEEVVPEKIRVKKTKSFRINYRKSNDITSIKAYRRSLNDKLRVEKLC